MVSSIYEFSPLILYFQGRFFFLVTLFDPIDYFYLKACLKNPLQPFITKKWNADDTDDTACPIGGFSRTN